MTSVTCVLYIMCLSCDYSLLKCGVGGVMDCVGGAAVRSVCESGQLQGQQALMNKLTKS